MIRVTFADGATEDREDDSPCIGSLLDPALKHPSEERWYLWLDGDRWPLSFCGHSASPLSQWRGWGAWVWRITSGKGEPLAGRWESCHVETCEEQIARLTAELDAAHQKYVLRDAHALLWKGWAREMWEEKREAWRTLQSLRDAARSACDREMGEGHRYPENVKVSTLVAHLNTMNFGAAEKARADAAEKRIADLRAWADELANGQSDSPEGRRVAGDFRAVVYRIDGDT